MNLVAYLRVSTDMQASSIENQLYQCQEYASKNGYCIRAVFKDENKSGSLPLYKRPGLFNAIEALQKGDKLIITRLDRLGRDPVDNELIEREIRKKKAWIISIAEESVHNDDPVSEMMRGILSNVTRFERRIIGTRISKKMQERKALGKTNGHVPYGFQLSKDGIHLEPNHYEQSVMSHMKKLKKRGFSVREMAAWLNNKSMLNRGNALWNHMSIFRIAGRDI